MIEIEDVTEEEMEKIEELKKRIEHEFTPAMLEDKSLYYRFLKARDFNIKRAEALLRVHLSDRKKYDFDDVVLKDYKPSAHMVEYFASSFVCYAKDGGTVRYADFGNVDLKGFLTLFTFKELFMYFLHYTQDDINKLTEQSKKLGKPITKFIGIINFDNLNMFQVTHKKGLQLAFELIRVFQDFFPERLDTLYIINVPAAFFYGYALAKPLFAKETLNRFRIFGEEGWKEALLEVIDADVLPAFLGGNRTDPDGNPLCHSLIVHAKKIPEELYMKKSSLINEKGVKKLNITRSSFAEVMVTVYEPDTLIEWEFETESGKIGFGLFYKNDSKTETEIEELVQLQKFDASVETGVFKCDKTGTYILVFDNSHGWLRSKDLYYRIRLTKYNENDNFNT